MKVSFCGRDGRPHWPTLTTFGKCCLDNAVKIDDRKSESTNGMQFFRTVAETGSRLKYNELEVERLIKSKTQEHEVDIFRAAVFSVGANCDGIVYMDGAISQIGSDDVEKVMAGGFHLEYAKLKDIYDRVGYYDECNSFIADLTGDLRRIDITSLCRLAKDADCSKD